ncbi:MAG: nicotinate-nucleotide adenylyltransferase [Cytophagaceae bacterium]|jgi:nicotinate-nucleotide adenylyltransferase|nr:nicotinate-nucleotide adenylyltransferase [Cytophagaceae bacterium]
MQEKRQRIGLLFGSFNPIHIGHTALANYILEYSNLYEIWFVVSSQNPFKNKSELMPETLRYEMVKTAIAKEPRFSVSDIEFHLPQPSYTINTLEKLTLEYPHYEFAVIIGSDNLSDLSKWKESEKLICSYRFIVYPRPNYPVKDAELPVNFEIIEAPLLNISSTMIRKSIKDGKQLSFLMPAGVYELMMKNNSQLS